MNPLTLRGTHREMGFQWGARLAESGLRQGKPVFPDGAAVLTRLTAGEMETLLRRLAGEEPSPAPAAVNRDFDQGRFQALKEG